MQLCWMSRTGKYIWITYAWTIGPMTQEVWRIFYVVIYMLWKCFLDIEETFCLWRLFFIWKLLLARHACTFFLGSEWDWVVSLLTWCLKYTHIFFKLYVLVSIMYLRCCGFYVYRLRKLAVTLKYCFRTKLTCGLYNKTRLT